jgi:hypothetical protein
MMMHFGKSGFAKSYNKDDEVIEGACDDQDED